MRDFSSDSANTASSVINSTWVLSKRALQRDRRRPLPAMKNINIADQPINNIIVAIRTIMQPSAVLNGAMLTISNIDTIK